MVEGEVHMRRCTMSMLLLVFFASQIVAEGGDIVETRTLRETIPLEGKQTVLLVVDNVFGPIHVKGHDKPQVEMVAEETTEALDGPFRTSAADALPTTESMLTNEPTPLAVESTGVKARTTASPSTNGDAALASTSVTVTFR